jgi:hypothetical protein
VTAKLTDYSNGAFVDYPNPDFGEAGQSLPFLQIQGFLPLAFFPLGTTNSLTLQTLLTLLTLRLLIFKTLHP